MGLEQKEAPHGQTTHIPHSGDSGELLRSSGDAGSSLPQHQSPAVQKAPW